MESKVKSEDLGGSLPVANVQELASKNLTHIPTRYIRPEIEAHLISEDEHQQEIPVIDLSRLRDHPICQGEMTKLHWACQHWGFFQMVNHGVSEELIDDMKSATIDFFKLSLEEKEAYAQQANSIEGYGQAFVVSEEQKLDWGDMLFLLPLPLHIRNLSFWPTHPPTFRGTLHKYSSELQRLTIYLLGLMAMNLGLAPEKLTNLFEKGVQGVRMNYYPQCQEADKVLGLSPHSDATGLTLLTQVNEVQGLQVRKNGNWIPVKPISGAFIVNIGDIIEILSNGQYKSIEHRAIINKKERLSIAAFHSPILNVMIGPLPDILKEKDCECYYKTISHDEYRRLVISTKLDGKSLLDSMKLKEK